LFPGLRSRLLISYITVIALTLCSVGLALLIILLNNPLPARIAYENLTVVARTSAPLLVAEPEQIDRRLAYIASSGEVQALRLTDQRTVAFDSSGIFDIGNTIELTPLRRDRRYGTYLAPDGQRWLYISHRLDQSDPRSDIIVFATPRPSDNIFNLMGSNLLRPLIQAGIIGLVLSVILVIGISRWVTRPLQRVSDAAHAIAAGDYDQRAPESGPREARELAAAFNHMAEQVQRSRQAQHDFLANVSHDLKTPLTSIQGYSQAILDGAAAEPAQAAQVIHDEAARMRRLVDDLLDLARIESGHTPLRRDRVNLSGLLDSVLANLSIQAGDKQIALVREVDMLPDLVGDGDRLAQVFTNLVDNAIAHTPPGGQIAVRAAAESGGIQIAVSDTGQGIPPEDITRIFERFYQVDKSRSREARKGAGLGLAICKQIVEAHGGHIRAESISGKGASFVVWLPVVRPSDKTVAHLSARS
jgi:signal transduction histidine kinase